MKALNSGPWLTGYCTMTGFTREAALMESNVGFETGLVGIELVDDSDDGFLEQAGVTGLNLASDLPSVLGIEEEYADVADLEGGEEASAEVSRNRGSR